MTRARELAELAAAYDSGGLSNMKNRIINGAMVIDQRNAGASVTMGAGIVYTVDRWFSFEDTDGVMTAQQITSAPSGFTNAVRCTTTTADASLGATQRVIFGQRIEGFNVADLAWGTASAQSITLSFWVRSSLTGTFGGSVSNQSNRSYPFTYAISSANTWEKKAVTIPGDTSGTWNSGSSTGIQLVFGLGVGTTYSGTAGAWAGSDLNSATGATSVIGTLNATWDITGVQLEKGSTATSFDYRPYGTELALCQRYYFQYTFASGSIMMPNSVFNNSTTNGLATIALPVPMRVAPSGITISSASHFTLSTGSSNLTPSAIAWTAAGPTSVSVNCTVTGATVGNSGLLYFSGTAGSFFGVSGTEL